MDGHDPLTIVIRPTNAFAEMFGPVMLRAWRGVIDGQQEPVIALIASLRSDAGDVELSHVTPIPLPDLNSTERITAAMGRMCRVISRLQPEEVEALAALGELVTGYADSQHHRWLAKKFCQDVLDIVR
jgi:hypothetical protein